MKTVHVIVKGLVQGVCFRDYTRREAERLLVTGWVRNCPDGTVETMVSGENERVAAMIKWLRKGSPHAEVTALEISEVLPEQFSSFRIRF